MGQGLWCASSWCWEMGCLGTLTSGAETRSVWNGVWGRGAAPTQRAPADHPPACLPTRASGRCTSVTAAVCPGHLETPEPAVSAHGGGRKRFIPRHLRGKHPLRGGWGRRVKEGEKGLYFKNVQYWFSFVPSSSSIVWALYFLRGIYCTNV